MKKLLFVTALLALGTMAFGENPPQGTKAAATVEVKAKIVDGNFIISDIDGKPIVIDFGELYADQAQSAVAYVDYKVTSKVAAATDPIKFDITLGGKADAPTEVTISTDRATGQEATSSMKANLTLSEYKGEMAVGTKEYIGRIDGTIASDELAGKEVGTYLGSTKLEISVTQ